MIPDEFDRKMDRLEENLSRLEAAQEQDREDRIRFEHWAGRLFQQQAQLLVHQSERMDYMEKVYDDLQRQTLRLLNMALDRLPPSPPNPS
jgi:hypothetical protein